MNSATDVDNIQADIKIIEPISPTRTFCSAPKLYLTPTLSPDIFPDTLEAPSITD